MIKTGYYKHFKGNIYEVLYVGTHTETEDVMVVYKELYNDSNVWIRPQDMFMEEVERGGYYIPRFKFIGNRAVSY